MYESKREKSSGFYCAGGPWGQILMLNGHTETDSVWIAKIGEYRQKLEKYTAFITRQPTGGYILYLNYPQCMTPVRFQKKLNAFEF